jgi:predicted heme/steroid binding protein
MTDNGYDLVYVSKRAKVAHLVAYNYYREGGIRVWDTTVCKMVGEFYGTGKESEYEHAASLPLCSRCLLAITNGARCVSCQKALQPEWVVQAKSCTYQFDNALWIAFHGGYGMFTDARLWHEGKDTPVLNSTGADHEAVICHDCAHDLCEKMPWIGALIQPYSSHAHRTHAPDHTGWDIDRQKEKAS